MEINVAIPKLPENASARLVKWTANVDDILRAGDVIAEIATAAGTIEVEAEADGQLTKILVEASHHALLAGTIIATIKPMYLASNVAIAAPPVTVSAPKKSMHSSIRMQSVREALREALIEEMRADTSVFILGEEVGEYDGTHKVTQGLLQEFGADRVVDTPITEHAFAGIAVGAAYAGMRPIVEFMTFNFALQAIDHIMNSAAKVHYISGGQLTCPIVFRGPNGAAPRVGAQHAQDFSAMFANIPGLKVVAPFTASDAKALLKSAIRDNNPVVFLENEILYGETFEIPAFEEAIPIGKAKVVRTGRDITLVSFSIGMTYALAAAEELAKQNISAEVIDLRTLRPLDTAAILESVRKTGRCVSIEEGWPQCGIGAEICALLMEHAFGTLKAPVLRVTGADVPMPYAARLEKLALPSVANVIDAAHKLMKFSR